MWIHPYIETTMWIHTHTKIPNVRAMWIHPYIEMYQNSEDIIQLLTTEALDMM